MQKTKSPELSDFKDQATRLGAYLTAQGCHVTRQQCLEALSHAVYGRPYNTVQATLQRPAAEMAHAAQPQKVDNIAYGYYDIEFGGTLPLSVGINLAGRAITFTVPITSHLLRATDEDLRSFMALTRVGDDVEPPRTPPWFLARLMREDNPFVAPHTVDDVQASPTPYTAYGVIAFFKAFYPERYRRVATAVMEGLGFEVEPLNRMTVQPAKGVPDQWVYVTDVHPEGCPESYGSRALAEAGGVDAWLESHGDSVPMLRRISDVARGRGTSGNH